MPGPDASNSLNLQAEILHSIENGGATADLLEALRLEFARSARLADRMRFLAELDATTRPLVDPPTLMQVTAKLLAEHLGVDRCAYANVENETVFEIIGDHARGVPSIVGRWEIAAFGPACVADLRGNLAYVVEDTDTDPRIPSELLASYRATTIRAVICVPLHKQGKLTAAMAVHQTRPRPWTADEIELVTIVVGGCWEALERAAVERRLGESRGRLDYAAQLAGIGFWYCDLPFDELMWDARTKTHFFLPADARVTIESFYDRIHPEDRQLTREAIETSIANHSSYDVVYRTVSPVTGEQKHVRALGGTAYAGDGTPLRFDGVTVDVTAQKRAEEKLRDQDRRKDEFLAMLAHELRNPLAPIRTGLELVRSTTDPQVVQRAHQRMERQVVHLVRMVDDLLDISRVTTGKLRLDEQHVDLGTVVGMAVETMQSVFATNGVELVLEPTAERLTVWGDPTRLAQIVGNLLNNAAKYTPRGGRVVVSSTRRGEQVEVTVEDTGIGIPPEKLNVVFEMFAQLGQSIDRSMGGLGIGLTLARTLAELHGGAILARSEGAGRGAAFTVRLPYVKTTPAPDSIAAPRARDAPLRILVVDDNVDAAELLAALLEVSGHAVRIAHTGQDALSLAAEVRPDLLLLDIGLPGIDGYEVARRIRAGTSPPQPMLFALTGWGSEEDRRRGRDAGFDEHLVKPVDQGRLATLLATVPRRSA